MIITNEVKDFSKIISGKIYTNYSLNKSNWFGLGGPAQIFFRPNTLNELILFLKKFGKIMPFRVIGAGSNILIGDAGFKGAIIKLGKNFSNISKLNNNTIIAGSLAMDKNVSEFAMDSGISGFEFLSCIPGTIGGAIRMNSGCYNNDISKILVSIQVVDEDFIVKSINVKQINFHYRGSDLSRKLIFLSATLKGNLLESKTIKEKIFNLVKKKKISQPSKIKTCGSTFRNPVIKTKKKAWELIKESGCAELIVGGASISQHHLNFFINNGNATAKDIEDLINIVRKRVLTTTGIELELELEIIGEKK